MKPKVLILLLAALSFCACSDDPIEPAADVALGSRGVVSSANASSSNPNLISDWENQQTITLNTITFDATANKVEAPWAVLLRPLLIPIFATTSGKLTDG